MSGLKSIWAICSQNFRKWASDHRMWIIGVLLIVVTAIYAEDMRTVANFLGTKPSMWIYPFVYMQFHTKVIYTLPIVMIFCDAPFTDKNQVFVYMRTSRVKWLSGQLLYIILASAVYYLFIFVLTVAFTFSYSDVSQEWGTTLNMLAYSNAAVQAGVHMFDVSGFVIEYFSPPQACFFTFLTSWLSAVVIGAILFFFNLFTGTRLTGITISSFLVVITVVVDMGGWFEYLKFSPISWNTLNNIDVGGMTAKPSFTYCMCVYAGIILTLTAAILLFGRKKSLDLKGD